MCQRADWEFHVFDCKTGKPISTIYYLARDMKRDVVPVHHQTRVDYGFDKAERILGAEGGRNLCSLYQLLMSFLDDPLADVRRWQKERRLVEGIRRAFESNPSHHTAASYRWFLEHPDFLDGSAVDDDTKNRQIKESVDVMVLNAWPYAGGSSSDTLPMVRSATAKFSKQEHECFFFAMILVGRRQDPETAMWLKFGFVAEQEHELRRRYTELIRRCTFEEFRTAYESSSISTLFAHHGISSLDRARDRLFRDVMSGSPTTFKSVWYLKQHVDELAASNPDEPHLAPLPELCVICDYGYRNCQKPEDEEWKLLDELYVRLFAKDGMDPLALHAACVKGELFDFVRGFVKLSPWTAKYARLLAARTAPSWSSRA